MSKTEAQKQAQKKYIEKNRDKMNYIRKKSACKTFISIANSEDLQEIQNWINERLQQNESL